MKRMSIWLSVLVLVFGNLLPGSLSVKAAGENETVSLSVDIADSYQNYLGKIENKKYPSKEILLPASVCSKTDDSAKLLPDYKGSKEPSLLTTEDGFAEWTVDISKDAAGLYNMALTYYPTEGKTTSIIRTVELDGNLPYSEARSIVFSRIWTDQKDESGKTITEDPLGNDIKPTQVEEPEWTTAFVEDSTGFENNPLYFYLSEGKHIIRLTSVQEPAAVQSLKLCQYDKPASYAEVKKEYEEKGYTAANAEPIKIQGEYAKLKSDPMIVPASERSSAATEPTEPAKLKLNTIGGTNWNQSGQWVSWSFTAEADGLYQIGLRTLQNFSAGNNSHRKIYIDGKIPFSELESAEIKYDSKWQMFVLGGGKSPYEFYLTKGTHTITMEVTLGSMAEILSKANTILLELNSIYRKILMLTGSVPDTSRDYQFDIAIPDALEQMQTERDSIKALYDTIEKSSNMNGANTQILYQLYLQLSAMVKKPDSIAAKFSSFQSNINALGAWINSSKQQPLTVDYLYIAPAGSKMPSASDGFFSEAGYQIKSFFYSFFVDYNRISYGTADKSVGVWVGSGLTGGRDQAQVLKSLADNYFTPKSKISVNMQLVSMGALLPASLAGKGPDVALSLSSSEAANYAFRNAAVNLAEFPDFAEIKKRFQSSAMTPLTFGDMVFGIPETQTFPMLYYRKDILSELGLSVPQTWDDVIKMLPVLQKKQLDFGLPTVSTVGSSMTMVTMMLYQYGGKLYSDSGEHSEIDSDVAYDAFSFLTTLYTEYQLPKQIDFINRFRIGSVPIGIADYTIANQLAVFAPELNGLWDFTVVPGIQNADGRINRSVPGGVTSSVIMAKAKNKDDAWEFVKWWTSSDMQVQFGRQLESIMGIAGRYPTANIEALDQIPWTKEKFTSLSRQWQSVQGIPEVPGSYYTPRNVDFAFRGVVYNLKDIDDCLSSAAKSIDGELAKKRKEFGITVAAEEGENK